MSTNNSRRTTFNESAKPDHNPRGRDTITVTRGIFNESSNSSNRNYPPRTSTKKSK